MTQPETTYTIRSHVFDLVEQYARRKPTAGQPGLFDDPSEKQRPLFSKKIDDENGHWLTIRGAHVFVSGEDGRILKGPKHFTGKTVKQVADEDGRKGEEKPPSPKPLNELGKITGGRPDNRQQKMFETIHPGLFDEKPSPPPAEEPKESLIDFLKGSMNERGMLTDKDGNERGGDWFRAELKKRNDSIPEQQEAIRWLRKHGTPAQQRWQLGEFSYDLRMNTRNDDPADGSEEIFSLQRPPAPSSAKPDFGNNSANKQSALFDTGKKGELKGQELLFNSDAGDLANPKTMENKVRYSRIQSLTIRDSVHQSVDRYCRDQFLIDTYDRSQKTLFSESDHPRESAGKSTGGQFISIHSGFIAPAGAPVNVGGKLHQPGEWIHSHSVSSLRTGPKTETPEEKGFRETLLNAHKESLDGRKLNRIFKMADGSDLSPEDQAEVDQLGIRPDLRELTLVRNEHGELKGYGLDSKNRRQPFYPSAHHARSKAEKEERWSKFTGVRDTVIRPRIEQDMESATGVNREAAWVAHLMDQTGMRVGSEDDTGADIEATGATTMDASHVSFDGDTVHMDFIGKSGHQNHWELNDPAFAEEMRFRVAKGGKIFQINDGQYRKYMKGIAPGFKPAKDFRYAISNEHAVNEIATMQMPKTAEEYRSAIGHVATVVSAKINNTPDVCFKSYIAPEVFFKWQANLLPKVPNVAELKPSFKKLDQTEKAHTVESTGQMASKPKKEKTGGKRALTVSKKDLPNTTTEVVSDAVERYCRNHGIMVPVDQYAHPLVHAGVGALAHIAVSHFAPRGMIKKIAHAAVASAMATWIAHANAGNQQPVAPANQTQPATATQQTPQQTAQQRGNNAVNQAVARAMAAHAQRQQAAANAPPSPNVQHAHAAATAAGAANGVNIPNPVAPAAPNASSSSAGKSGATGARPLRDPGDSGRNFNGDQHPRETTTHDSKRPGEFAPKGEGQTGGGESPSSSAEESKAAPESSTPSPRNYPDNLNKPADQQTPYESRGEDMTGGTAPEPKKSHDELIQEHLSKIAAGKTIDTPEEKEKRSQDRKAHWAKTVNDMMQSALDKKDQKKSQKQQAKEQESRVSFDPKKLEAESSKTVTVQQSKKSIIPDIASEHDLDHETLSNAVQDELKMILTAHKRQEEARQYISKMGWNAGRINRKEDSYKDHSTTNLDENASEWAGLFPEIAGSDESEWVSRMWDLSKQGKQDPPNANDEDLVRSVAKRLVDQGYANSSDSTLPAEEESDSDLQPVHGSPGDADYTPFSRAYIDMIVDKYLRIHGVC